MPTRPPLGESAPSDPKSVQQRDIVHIRGDFVRFRNLVLNFPTSEAALHPTLKVDVLL